ncbi:MAG: hypothetical protein ACREKN_05190 [Longimicrobiaceae bacterium]
MNARIRGTMALALVWGLAGCEDSALEPAPGGLSQAEAEALGVLFAELADQGTEGAASEASENQQFNASLAPGSVNADLVFEGSYTRTRDCPLGGQVIVDGEVSGQRDSDTGTMTATISAVKTPVGCTFAAQGTEVTVGGDPNLQIDANVRRVDGRRSGTQTLTQVGAVAWSTADGRDGSCEIDVTRTIEPEDGTRVVEGTVCGREFSRSFSWEPGGND